MRVTVAALITAALLPLLPVNAAELTPPTWPQTRTVAAGATAWVTVPITQVGAVTLTLAWKNGPLAARVIAPSGAATPVTLTTSPVRVSLNVTAAELQKGPVWSLALSVAETARLTAPVEATVVYEGSAADRVALQTYVTRMAAARTTASNAVAQKLSAQVQEQITANQQTLTAQIAKQNLELGTRLLSSTKAIAAVSPLAPVRPGMRPVDAIRPDVIAPLPQGRLLTVNPARGVPGDIVTLKATDLVPANRWSPDYVKLHTAVWFTINPNFAALASVTGVSKDTDGATLLQTRVPVAAAAVVNAYDGNVYIKSDSFGYTTAAQPFRWEPTPKPAIAAVVPAEGVAGNWVTLKGQNFTANDQVFVVDEGGAETKAEMRYQSASELQAKVPNVPFPGNAVAAPSGAATLPRTVSLYVKSMVNNAGVKSNSAAFQLLPPPTITALDRVSGLPGETLLVSGVGFQKPVVHFVQPQGGKDYTATPKSGEWNVSQVYVALPEIPLVPIEGMQLQVSVESNGVRSTPSKFTLMPILVEMPLPEIACTNFKKHDESDSMTSWNNTVTVYHYANDLFAFHYSTDTVAPTVTLRYGWKVARIETKTTADFADGVDSHVGVELPTLTSTNLTTKVNWWVRCQGGVSCSVAYIIQGPKGVPYK